MGKWVNLLDEIRNRINTATGSTGVLSSVHQVLVGPVEMITKDFDLPVIVIYPTGGRTEPVYMRGGQTDEINLTISMIQALGATDDNTLYKSLDSTGFIYDFESLMNVIEKNITGTVDLTFDSDGNNLPIRDYQFNYSENLLRVDINLTVQTAQFTWGAR